MPGIRQRAIEFRQALAGAEPGTSTPARCAEIAEELARTEKACAAARIRFAARAAVSGEHRKRGFADASDWLAAASGSSRRDARDALTTVAQAGPELRDALVAGEVSLGQAAEIVTAPAQHEAELIALAGKSGLGAVRDTARKRRLAAMDVEQLHAQRHTARGVVHWKDKTLGMICGCFALPPEVGIPFVNRLDRETDRPHDFSSWPPAPMLLWGQKAASGEPGPSKTRRGAYRMNLFVVRTWLSARFTKTERGASMVEYILLVALIALAVIAAVVFLKNQVNSKFNDAGSKLSSSG